MKIGDQVRFLSEVGGGKVAGFQGKNVVLVEDEDGFQMPMLINEVVVVGEENYDTSHVVEVKSEKKKVKSDCFVGARRSVSGANTIRLCANRWQHDPNDADAPST